MFVLDWSITLEGILGVFVLDWSITLVLGSFVLDWFITLAGILISVCVTLVHNTCGDIR